MIERGGDEALLGTDGRVLVAFREVPGAQPAPRSTGLFHVALLLPEREDLARWLAHAIRDKVALSGASDHYVSEALYLRDPDYHGIEIYADRPRELWDGHVERMGTDPLDVASLLGVLRRPGDGGLGGAAGRHDRRPHAPAGRVDSRHAGLLPRPAGVRRDDHASRRRPRSSSAGGYHHHLGGNTWNSLGAGPPPEGAAALERATIVLPDAAERDRLVAKVADAGRSRSPATTASRSAIRPAMRSC